MTGEALHGGGPPTYCVSGSAGRNSGHSVSIVLLVANRLRRMIMHWPKTYAFGSHLVDWLALAVAIVVTFAAHLGARRFIVGLLTRKRDKGKGEREYWYKHEG
jgi:hypothetical protein